MYKLNSWCPFGYGCVFLKSHLSADNKLLGSEEVFILFLFFLIKVLIIFLFKNAKNHVKELNSVSKDLLNKLRKKEVLFPKSKPIIEAYNAAKEQRKTNSEISDDDSLFYKETRLKKKEKKKLDFKGKLYLAPLTTTGNLPFRRICKMFGADITWYEIMISTKKRKKQF